MTILTEAGTNAYALTPIIANLAGARQVCAVLPRNGFSPAADHVGLWTKRLVKENRIHLCPYDTRLFWAERADIVTNLGNVRPIDAEFVSHLKDTAVVSLMMEGWEVRREDVDIRALRQKKIPVLSTNEDPLGIWEYCGPLVLKILLEKGIELHKSRVLLAGDSKFVTSAYRFLAVFDWVEWSPIMPEDTLGHDAVVVSDWAGKLDRDDVIYLTKNGRMMKTLGDLGPRPVIELHAAGLKVGELMTRAVQMGLNGVDAEVFVLTLCDFAEAYLCE